MPLDSKSQATRDQVVAEARAHDLEGLIDLVEQQTARFHAALRAAVAAVPSGHAGEDWTPIQVGKHLVQRSVLRAREVLYVALSGEVPPPEDAPLPDDPEGLIQLHREAIDSLYEHVRSATDDFDGITWDHPTFGPWNWREWMVFISVHTGDHAEQLERMIGPPPA